MRDDLKRDMAQIPLLFVCLLEFRWAIATPCALVIPSFTPFVIPSLSRNLLVSAGPSAKGIYFSQGFAKNQIPSAIAMPPLKTRTNIVAGGHYLFHLQRESRTQSVWRCRWCHFLPTCNVLPFHLQRIQHAAKTKTMRKRSWPRAEGCTRLPPTINVKVTKVARTASTFATPPPMYVQNNGLAARFWCTYIG